jgi:putative phosphoesterase
MRTAFISDIHGNYDALRAVIKKIKKIDVKKIYCLGDIVNYYYDPDKCIDLLLKNEVQCIKGNHEKIFLKILKNKKLKKFYAKNYGNSIFMNLKKLKKKHIDFIKSLPNRINLKINKKKIILSHGAPWNIDFYFYKNTKKKWIEKIKKYDAEIFILGHTHHPMNLRLKNNKTVLNPGSVGQPRNLGSNAYWLLINDKDMKINFMKTKYPLKNLIKSIYKNDKNNKSLLKYFQ